MSRINEHMFNFNIPMFPTQRVSDNGMSTELIMDGQPLQGVTSVCIKAGSNGFTNVAIEFEASCAVQFVGHLCARVYDAAGAEEHDLKLAEIFRDVNEEIRVELEQDGANLMQETYAQAKFVQRIIETAMERL